MKESISVFDVFKIGIGPSSSHTLGPWRAAQRFIQVLNNTHEFHSTHRIVVKLYGSLALTGKGHGTDIAIILGLSGFEPESIAPESVLSEPKICKENHRLNLSGKKIITFTPDQDLLFLYDQSLPFHANGMSFEAQNDRGKTLNQSTYYSVGGGFVVQEKQSAESSHLKKLPYPIEQASDISDFCQRDILSLSQLVMKNENCWRSEEDTDQGLLKIWQTMKECVFNGCNTPGTLPGGLNVKRRAPGIYQNLLEGKQPDSSDELIERLQSLHCDFSTTLKWIGCFAMAVNEENANFGRIVTAPTNGAAGVIPAVLFYFMFFSGKQKSDADIIQFLLVAGEIGSIFKKGATISAAMGGCQAEIGVSSAMAAAALADGLGGTVEQSLMAAEIAMEHHLGLTCDPVGGLVQIPCIERNSMGAMKAITAANIAIESDPKSAKISLDDVVKTMWETAQDMNAKYKETSQGGLATRISIVVPEC